MITDAVATYDDDRNVVGKAHAASSGVTEPDRPRRNRTEYTVRCGVGVVKSALPVYPVTADVDLCKNCYSAEQRASVRFDNAVEFGVWTHDTLMIEGRFTSAAQAEVYGMDGYGALGPDAAQSVVGYHRGWITQDGREVPL